MKLSGTSALNEFDRWKREVLLIPAPDPRSPDNRLYHWIADRVMGLIIQLQHEKGIEQ